MSNRRDNVPRGWVGAQPHGDAIPEQIHPQMAAALAMIADLGASIPDWRALPLPEWRAHVAAERSYWNVDAPAMNAIAAFTIPTPVGAVPVRLYKPQAGHAMPVIVFVHGGGWVLGSLNTYDRTMRMLAQASGAAVLGIEYSLAPEAKFPRALDEIAMAVEWIADHAADYGLASGRLGVAGDSAGANLALSATVSLASRRPGLVKALLLLYGCYLPSLDTPSYRRYGDGRYGLSTDEMGFFWGSYLREEADRWDPRAAPMEGPLRGLPPTLIVAAELDPLHDDSIRLAAALSRAGSPHVLKVWRGMCHGFIQLSRMVDDAAAAIAECGGHIAMLLSQRRSDGT